MNNSILDRKILLAFVAISGSIAITIQENYSIHDKIPYFEPTTLRKEANLCSNENIDRMLGQSTLILLASGSTFLVSKLLLDFI